MRSSMRKKMKSRTNNKETIFIHRIRRAKSCGFFKAARVFFDRNRIELYDEENSIFEDRFDTIGNAAIGMTGTTCDILFVVYTDRVRQMVDGVIIDVT